MRFIYRTHCKTGRVGFHPPKNRCAAVRYNIPQKNRWNLTVNNKICLAFINTIYLKKSLKIIYFFSYIDIIVNVIGCDTVYISISSSFSPLSYKGGANFGFAPPLSFTHIFRRPRRIFCQFPPQKRPHITLQIRHAAAVANRAESSDKTIGRASPFAFMPAKYTAEI